MKPGDENGSGGTLSGNKRLVYVLMKIYKKCYEDVNITSFKVLEINLIDFNDSPESKNTSTFEVDT